MDGLISEKTVDLNRAAGTYDIFTATGGDMVVEWASVYIVVAPGGALTSIRIHTNQTTVYDFLTAAEGAVAGLLVQKTMQPAELGACGKCQLKSGQKIQVTIGGGAGGAGTLANLVVKYRPTTVGSGLLL